MPRSLDAEGRWLGPDKLLQYTPSMRCKLTHATDSGWFSTGGCWKRKSTASSASWTRTWTVTASKGRCLTYLVFRFVFAMQMSRRLSSDGEFVSAAITPSYGFVCYAATPRLYLEISSSLMSRQVVWSGPHRQDDAWYPMRCDASYDVL